MPAYITSPRPAQAVTPSAVTATVTGAETFTENGVQHRNLVTASFLADAHDSQTEILNKGFRFLDLFSQSQYTPAEVLADFDQATGGYDGELRDVVNNRNTYVQLPGYSIQRLPPVTFNFGGICPIYLRLQPSLSAVPASTRDME